MGEEIKQENGLNPETEKTGERPGTGSSTANTEKSGTARTIGRRRRPRTGTAEKEQIPQSEILAVNPDEKKPNKVDVTAPDTDPVKKPTRKRRTTVKKPTIDTVQLDAVIISISALIASRPEMGHWMLTKDEVQSVTKPLANMLEKSDKLNFINENSDAIALVMACGMILVPRIAVTAKNAKEKKKKEVTGNVTDTTVKPDGGDKKGEGESPSRKDAGKPTTTRKDYGADLSFLGATVA